jgi:hypothetical protein
MYPLFYGCFLLHISAPIFFRKRFVDDVLSIKNELTQRHSASSIWGLGDSVDATYRIKYPLRFLPRSQSKNYSDRVGLNIQVI